MSRKAPCPQWIPSTAKNARPTDGVWRLRYTGPDLKRHSLQADTEQDVLALYYADQAAIENGTWVSPSKRRSRARSNALTLRAWIDEYLLGLQRAIDAPRASTIQKRAEVLENRVLKPVGDGADVEDLVRLANLPLDTITKADCRRWWDAMLDTYPESRDRSRKAYSILRSVFAEAVERELIAENPCTIKGAGAKAARVRLDPLPEDWEVKAIINGITPRYQLLTCLILAHGLRIGEALGLEVGDVHLSRDTPPPLRPTYVIDVRQSLVRVTRDGRSVMQMHPPKTAAGTRTVPFLRSFEHLITEHQPHLTGSVEVDYELSPTCKGRQDFHLLTTTEKGNPVTDTSYRSRFNRAAARAGCQPGIHPHSGRKFLITRLAEQGAHLKEIGTILGQEDLSTIMDVYMKVNSARPPELMERVNLSLSRKNTLR